MEECAITISQLHSADEVSTGPWHEESHRRGVTHTAEHVTSEFVDSPSHRLHCCILFPFIRSSNFKALYLFFNTPAFLPPKPLFSSVALHSLCPTSDLYNWYDGGAHSLCETGFAPCGRGHSGTHHAEAAECVR